MRKAFIIFDKKGLIDLLKYGSITVENDDFIVYIYQHNPDIKLEGLLKLIENTLGIKSISIRISGNFIEIIHKFTELLRDIVSNETCPYITLSKDTTCSADLITAILFASFFPINGINPEISEFYYLIYYSDYALLFSNREIIGLVNYLNFENIYPKKKDYLGKFVNALLSLKSANNRQLANTLGLSEKSTNEFSKLLERLRIIEAFMRKREKMYVLNSIVRSFASGDKKPYFCVDYTPARSKTIAFVNSRLTFSYILTGYKVLNIEKIYYIDCAKKDEIEKLLNMIDFPKNNFRCLEFNNTLAILEIELKGLTEERSLKFYIEIADYERTAELLEKFLKTCLKYDANTEFNIYSNGRHVSFTPQQFKNLFITPPSHEEVRVLKVLVEIDRELDEKFIKYYKMLGKILYLWDFRPMPYNVADQMIEALEMIEEKKRMLYREVYRALVRNKVYYSRNKVRDILFSLQQKELIKIEDKKMEIPHLVKVYYTRDKQYREIINFLGKVAHRFNS